MRLTTASPAAHHQDNQSQHAYPGGSGTGASGSNLATPKAANYFTYTGTQTLPYQQNYNNTNGTFYKECNSSFGTNPGVSIGSSPGVSVFTYVTVSSTSGPAGADERTNSPTGSATTARA